MAVFHFVDMSRKIAFLPKCFEFVLALCKFFEKIRPQAVDELPLPYLPQLVGDFPEAGLNLKFLYLSYPSASSFLS